MKRSLRVEGKDYQAIESAILWKQIRISFSRLLMQHVKVSSVHVPEAPVDDDRKSLTADAVKVGQTVY